jgi:hypothetical protein
MITTRKLAQYRNGSFLVSLYSDGTKVREQTDSEGIVEFPESIDLKITEVCDLNCSYCHENGRENGNHARVENIDKVTNGLPPGVEIAIGGGNPFEHPQLKEILILLKNKGLVASLTVNELHLFLLHPLRVVLLKEWQQCGLIYGIGISIRGYLPNSLLDNQLNDVVWHCILGESTPFDVLALKRPCKVLLLGDKKYGRGKDYFANDKPKIDYWKYHLGMVLSREDLLVSFDNLAIEQLDLKSKLPGKVWDKYYMGDDGQFTMYVDAVKMQYAKNSISERVNVAGLNIREMFQKVRGLKA